MSNKYSNNIDLKGKQITSLPCSDTGSKVLANSCFMVWSISNVWRDSWSHGWMTYDPATAGVSWLWLRRGLSLFAQESAHGAASGSSRTLVSSCGPWSLAQKAEGSSSCYTMQNYWGLGCWPICSWRRETFQQDCQVVYLMGGWIHWLSHELIIPAWEQTWLSAYLALLWLQPHIFTCVWVWKSRMQVSQTYELPRENNNSTDPNLAAVHTVVK